MQQGVSYRKGGCGRRGEYKKAGAAAGAGECAPSLAFPPTPSGPAGHAQFSNPPGCTLRTAGDMETRLGRGHGCRGVPIACAFAESKMEAKTESSLAGDERQSAKWTPIGYFTDGGDDGSAVASSGSPTVAHHDELTLFLLRRSL